MLPDDYKKPLIYTQDLADKVCEWIMEGLSLRKIALIEDMPSRFTMLRWLRENKDFQIQYAHAREEQAEFYADEIIQISDDTTDPAKGRLQVDSRKWIAAKLKPKKYGDSAQLKHADADGNKLAFNGILGALDGRSAGLPGAEEAAE